MTQQRKLTLKRQKFVAQFLIEPNATKAALAAGYSPHSAYAIGHELLKNPEVAAALALKTEKTLGKLDISVERVLKERARLAFFDPRKLLDNTGRPLALNDLDDDTAAAIAGLDVQDKYEKGGDGEAGNVSTIVKYKLADKNASLTALEKHLGMYQAEEKGEGALSIFIHLEAR